MDKEYLKNKIEGLRHHFVESTIHERAMGFLWWSSYDQKDAQNKKEIGFAWDGTVLKEDWAQGCNQDRPKDCGVKTAIWDLLPRTLRREWYGTTPLCSDLFDDFDHLKCHELNLCRSLPLPLIQILLWDWLGSLCARRKFSIWIPSSFWPWSLALSYFEKQKKQILLRLKALADHPLFDFPSDFYLNY